MSRKAKRKVYLVLSYIEGQLCDLQVYSTGRAAHRAVDVWVDIDSRRAQLLREHPDIPPDQVEFDASSLSEDDPYFGTMVYEMALDDREQVRLDKMLTRSRAYRQTKAGALVTRKEKKRALFDLVTSTDWAFYSNVLASALRLSIGEVYDIVEECELDGSFETDHAISLTSGETIIKVFRHRGDPVE